jgi:hypothetical protein
MIFHIYCHEIFLLINFTFENEIDGLIDWCLTPTLVVFQPYYKHHHNL